jgi:FixJ family two-component response regulator
MQKSESIVCSSSWQKSVSKCLSFFVTGHGDILMSVQAMKAGAVEFLAKPFRDQALLDAITTERTIKFHRVQIMRKMEAQSVAELVRFAYGLGIAGPA